MSQTTKNLKEHILRDIETGKITQKPKMYFVWKSLLYVSAIVISVLSFLYLASMVLYVLRRSNLFSIPHLGLERVGVILYSTPWLLVLSALAFLVILYILIRHFEYSVRTPFVYTLMAFVIFSLCGPYLLVRMALHERIEGLSMKHEIQLFIPFYQRYGKDRSLHFTVGRITEVTENGFLMMTQDGSVVSVSVHSDTNFPRRQDKLQIADVVLVRGALDDNSIQAKGVRTLDNGVIRQP